MVWALVSESGLESESGFSGFHPALWPHPSLVPVPALSSQVLPALAFPPLSSADSRERKLVLLLHKRRVVSSQITSFLDYLPVGENGSPLD